MGTVQREPIETADRGVAAACVRSGISGLRAPNGARPIPGRPGRRCWPTARPAAVFCLGLGDRRRRSSSATAARNSWPQGSLRMYSHAVGFGIGRARPLLESAQKGGRVTPLLRVSSCARRRRLGQRFRSGGAGAQLWGLFSASRSKPLTAGWLRRVCALAFQACGRRTARGQFLVALVADAGRRRGPPLFSVWDLAIGGGGARRQQPLATAGRRAAFGCTRTLLDLASAERDRSLNLLERGPRYAFAARFLVRAKAAPRPAFSIRRRRRAAMGTVQREPIETADRGGAALTRFVSFPAHARRQPSAVAIWPRRRSGVRLFSVSV